MCRLATLYYYVHMDSKWAGLATVKPTLRLASTVAVYKGIRKDEPHKEDMHTHADTTILAGFGPRVEGLVNAYPHTHD